MGIGKVLKNLTRSHFRVATITTLDTSGHHSLSDGHAASALTDEQLKVGDRVVVVKDDRGKSHILGGDK